jgi:hypothetical protein
MQPLPSNTFANKHILMATNPHATTEELLEMVSSMSCQGVINGTSLEFGSVEAGVTVTYLRSYITGNIDAILGEVGPTTTVSPVGAD